MLLVDVFLRRSRIHLLWQRTENPKSCLSYFWEEMRRSSMRSLLSALRQRRNRHALALYHLESAVPSHLLTSSVRPA